MQLDGQRRVPGESATWRAWHFGVPLKMTSRITKTLAPHYFDDEQICGPFRHCRHRHEFAQDAQGTTMIDRIDFSAPFGSRGRLVEELLLARYLQNFIEERNRHVAGLD